MKKLTYILRFVCLPLLIGTLGCSTDDIEVTITEYVHLDSSSFTFAADGEEAFTINITADPKWDVTINDTWITESARTESSISFTAQANETGAIRNGTVTITAGHAKETIHLSQLCVMNISPETKFTMLSEFTNLSMNVCLSHSGRYVAGLDYYYEYDWSTYEAYYYYRPIIIDLETGDVRTYDIIENIPIGIKAISDDGETMLIANTFQWVAYLRNNEISYLDIPSDFQTNDTYVDTFSADGSIVYGYGRKRNDSRYYPIRWTNGVAQVMELYDTDGQGAAMGSDRGEGNRVLGTSADGSVTYGVDQSTNQCVYWDRSGVHFAAADRYFTVTGLIDLSAWGYGIVESTLHNQGEINFSATDRMSADGKYIAMRFYDADIVDMWYDDYYRPVRFNTETGETEIFFDIENMSGLTVDNDGVLYLIHDKPREGSDSVLPYMPGVVFDPATDAFMTCRDWMMEKYGIITPDLQVTKVGANGNILARTYVDDNGTQRAVPCMIIPGN